MWAALAGVGMGALKHRQELKQAERDRQTQSAIAAYSPWTGMQASAVKEPDLMGNLMSGGAAGMGMGQNMAAAEGQEKMQGQQGRLVDAQTDYYNAKAGQQPQGSAGAVGANAGLPGGYARPGKFDGYNLGLNQGN